MARGPIQPIHPILIIHIIHMGMWQQGHWPLPLVSRWARPGVTPEVDATGTAVMSTSTSTAIPILTGTSTARITGRIWKHVGKEGKGRGNMTRVTGGASHIEIKGWRSGSTGAVMRELRRHGRLFAAGLRVVGKSWHVVERTGSAKEVVW